MVRYALQRLLSAVPTLLGLSTIVFFVVHLAPGDPAALYISPDIQPDVANRLAEQFGLNEPLHVRYLKWLGNVARGELGVSFRYQRPVVDVIAEAITPTLLLSGSALLIEIVLGIAFGYLMAAKRGSSLDLSLSAALLVFYSVPGFWLALLCVLLFSLILGWLPSSQMHSLDARLLSPGAYAVDLLRHMVMPVGVLAVRYAAAIAHYLRAGLLEALTEPYILTARAKGLDDRAVLLRHAFRNAAGPLVTIVGLELGYLLSGALVIEAVFAWPGMGLLTVDAIFARDYPVIVGTTLVSGAMVMIGNLFADLLLAAIDPRLRLGRRKS